MFSVALFVRQEHMPGSKYREQFATAVALQAGLLLRAKQGVVIAVGVEWIDDLGLYRFQHGNQDEQDAGSHETNVISFRFSMAATDSR